MRFRRLLGIAMAWIGATVVAGGAASGARSRVAPPATPPPELEAACSDHNWVAFTESREEAPLPCPRISGWAETELFALPLRPARRFCSYEFEPVPPTPPGRYPYRVRRVKLEDAIEALKNDGTLHGTVRRCAVVGASQSQNDAEKTLAETNREVLYRELRFQVGVTDLPLEANKTPNVLLSIVDTQADGDDAPTSLPAGTASPHGYALAHIAHDLTCGGSCDSRICAAKIKTRLALGRGRPLLEETSFSSAGGSVGSPSDVAKAIIDEVTEWPEALSSPEAPTSETAPRHLILNLSVGWDPELLAAERGSDGVNAEEVAVYDALVFARERGALPIAAAGNGHGGKNAESGATLPARWYAVSPGFARSDAREPVVWAIGAVNRDDVALVNSRPNSMPPLVAYSDHAVVPPTSEWTDPLTGTSVSAVVASSIAAVVWHLRPEIGAEEVMTVLERSAIPLGRPAKLYRGTVAAPQVGRLSFTRAMTLAWSGPTFYTSQIDFPGKPVSCGMASVLSCKVDGENGGEADEQLFVCPGPAPSDALCPTRYRALSSVPWVLPQPDSDPCSNCTLSGKPPGDEGDSGWQVNLELTSTWEHCLTDIVLDVQFPDATQRKKYWIAPGSDFCGGSLKIEGLPFDSEPSSVALIANVKVGNKDYTVRSPLYVGWNP